MPDDGRSRLGRGLAALIGDVGVEATATERARSQRRVPIEFLKPNPRNPRRNFPDIELDELAASIRERGIVQPIVVRPARGYADTFEIIARARRSAPACTGFRSSRSTSTTTRRCSSRSSRTCALLL